MFASAILPLVLVGGILALIIWLIKILVSSMKKHPDEHFAMQTQKSTQELADQIKRIAGELGANIDRIQDDPLGQYGTTCEIAVVLSAKNRDVIGSNWAVQIYIADAGDVRNIELVALSEQAGAYYGGIKISESRAKSEIIASRLK